LIRRCHGTSPDAWIAADSGGDWRQMGVFVLCFFWRRANVGEELMMLTNQRVEFLIGNHFDEFKKESTALRLLL
jgi:hypothetical protein